MAASLLQLWLPLLPLLLLLLLLPLLPLLLLLLLLPLLLPLLLLPLLLVYLPLLPLLPLLLHLPLQPLLLLLLRMLSFPLLPPDRGCAWWGQPQCSVSPCTHVRSPVARQTTEGYSALWLSGFFSLVGTSHLHPSEATQKRAVHCTSAPQPSHPPHPPGAGRLRDPRPAHDHCMLLPLVLAALPLILLVRLLVLVPV